MRALRNILRDEWFIMQQEIFDILKGTRLVAGMADEDILSLLASSRVRLANYQKGEIIFQDGDVPERLFLLIKGDVRILKDTFSGKQIFITEIKEPGDMFGEVYLCIAKRAYDMYAEAAKDTTLLEISNAMLSLQTGGASHITAALQQNLLKGFAAKAYFMNNKLKVLASGSLRGKIARYLLQRPQKDGWIELAESREATAAYLAVTRPSLSRELSALQAEGILEIEGKTIRILDVDRFEEYL